MDKRISYREDGKLFSASKVTARMIHAMDGIIETSGWIIMYRFSAN
jgi:hypothetical protein